MKQLFLSIIIFFLISTIQSQDSCFNIKINLTDLPEETNIHVVYFVDGEFNSIKEVERNLFSGSLSEVSPVFISFPINGGESVEIIHLFIYNEDVVVSGTIDDYRITGSKTQDVYEKWRKETNLASKNRGKALYELNAMQQQDFVDSVKWKKKMDSFRYHEKIKTQITKEFIYKNISSLTSVFLLDNSKTNMLMDTIRAIFSKIPDENSDSRYYKDLALYTTIIPVEEGDDWKNFKAFNKDGLLVDFQRLNKIDEKFILLVFSSPGCVPCEKSIVELKKIYEEYNRQLEVVTYNQSISVKKLVDKAKRNNISWTFLGAEKSDYKTMYEYGAYGTPKFVLISPARKILYSWNMGYKKGELMMKIDELVK